MFLKSDDSSLAIAGPECFHSCIDAHIDGLYSYAVILTRNYREAEKLVQETYTHARDTIARPGIRNKTKSWLFVLLRNLWLDHLRCPSSISDSEEFIVQESLTDSLDANASETDLVRNAMLQMPLHLREIIVLREYQGLTYGEIASILDCTVWTVAVLLVEARSNLRKLLPVALQASN